MLAVILAGGRSRRMGRDKAEIPFRGTTLLLYLAGLYRAAGFTVAVSQRDVPGTIRLEDIFAGCGPMAGLHSAFRQTDAEAVFLTAVDIPYGSPRLAETLASRLGGHDACVIKRKSGLVESLFAVYGRGCLEKTEALLTAGERRMTELISKLDTAMVSEEELVGFELDKILLNVNTTDEYRAFLKIEECR